VTNGNNLDSWIDYIERAEMLIDNGYVRDITVEELAKKLQKKDRDESRSSFSGEG